jgi:predicted transcriptional regulator
MVVTKKIMELLKNETRITAKLIAQKTETKESCVKTTLSNLCKRGRVLREKALCEHQVKTGPKNIYVYFLP